MAVANTLPKTMREPVIKGFKAMDELSQAFRELGVNTTILSALNYQNSGVANTNSIT